MINTSVFLAEFTWDRNRKDVDNNQEQYNSLKEALY